MGSFSLQKNGFCAKETDTSKSKHAVKNFAQVKQTFLQEDITTVQDGRNSTWINMCLN